MTNLTSLILDLAVAIQQIPAPTFHEQQRAEFVRGLFAKENLSDVEMDAMGNVYARLPAPRHSPALSAVEGSSVHGPVVVSAHLDTVFPANTDLTVFREAGRIAGAGIGDNSVGVAGLFGLAWSLRERRIDLTNDLWLVANVCEEGLGDLRGMKAVVDRFGSGPAAYIVLEGMSLGSIYHRALGVRRYRITARTEGGHSWIDYGRPSAVHELTRLAARITALKLPQAPRTTLNVGTISGGTSVNTIAAEAMLELDLRSEGWEVLGKIAAQVEDLVRESNRPGVETEAQVIGQRPTGEIPAEHPLVRLAETCLQDLGFNPHLNIGSTDANQPLSRGFPAVTIGLTTGSGAHTVHEYINVDPLEKGMEQVVRLVSSIQ
jgi:acetylornithine deacetylase/succinyl-diaminopimelate desuccinylase-like protein